MRATDTVLADLRRARELIADPEHWTTTVLAHDGSGGIVSPDSPRARCWCAVGALVRAGSAPAHQALEDLIDEQVRPALGHSCLEEVNDEGGHAAVLALFDLAISRLEG